MTRTITTLLVASALGAGVMIPPALAATDETTRVSIHDDDATQPDQPSLGAAVSADGRYVAFTTKAQLTGTATGGKEQLYVRDRQTGATVLVSASATGEPANDNVDSEDAGNIQYAISGDGGYVTFASVATNLIMPDANTNGKDVFRKDMRTGAIVRVNVSAQGAQSAMGVGGDPDISYDGSRVVFNSGTATDLFGSDSNTVESDVVLHDISTNATTLMSQSSSGVQATHFTERPTISADGRFVAFQTGTDPTNLFSDNNAASDVFVRDTAAGTTVVASIATNAGTPGGAEFPDISGNGRYVAFAGPEAYDPVNAQPATKNVYRRDLVASTTVLVSARNGQAEGGNGNSEDAAISADGSRVAFTSTATNLLVPFGGLLTEDTNAALSDIYVHIPGAGAGASATTRASTKTNAQQGANASALAAVAGNGGLVAFTYDDNPGPSPMVADDTNTKLDVFAKELIPSDSAGPAIAVSAPVGAAQRTEAGQATITGTVAADPSGNVETAVAGTPVARAANGSFNHTVPLTFGINNVAITARDGAGNLTTTSVAVERLPATVITPQPPTIKPKASRITQLKVIAGLRKITMRFQLSRRGTITAQLKRLPKLTAVRKPFVRFKRIGKNSMVMPIPRLSRGKYRLILTVKSDGGTTRITRTFLVTR